MKEIAYWLMYSFCDSYNDRHFVSFVRNAPIYFQLVALANLLMNLVSIFLAAFHLIR